MAKKPKPPAPANPHLYPDWPRIGVIVVVVRDDTVLLIQRGKEPHQGKWGLPGGGVELGETLFETAIRELKEEAGIVIEPYAVVDIKEEIHPDETGKIKFHFYPIIVGANWVKGEGKAADDAADLRWVPLSEIKSLSGFPDTEALVRKALLTKLL